MPLYEYRCANCGQCCEILQKVNDEPASKCPDCQQDQLKRQISAPGFQLKGTGWYTTDFKKSAKKPQADAPKPKADTSE